MSEGVDRLDVTRCIKKKSAINHFSLHPPTAYITDVVQIHSSILRSISWNREIYRPPVNVWANFVLMSCECVRILRNELTWAIWRKAGILEYSNQD